MKRTLPVLSVAVLLAATFIAGALHGRMSGRWGLEEAAETAAERLAADLPSEVGNWQLLSKYELGSEVVKVLQCPAYIGRTYKHQQTGDVANILVLVGPPGPISAHTPEICFSSRDFNLGGERRKVTIPTASASGLEQSFWELPLKSNNIHAATLRVFYGWNAGKDWEAAAYPRFAYGGLSHLYKLQVEISSNPTAKSATFDAGRDFLAAFLVQLQPHLVEARTPAGIVR